MPTKDPFDELVEETKSDPLNSLLEEEFSSPFTATATHTAAVAVGPATPIPKADETNLVCLRGPCEFYFEARQRVLHGNPIGTFDEGEEPRQVSRICRRFEQGMDLTDEAVYDCNSWVPLSRSLRKSREKNRKAWAKKNNRTFYDREAK